MTDKEKKQVETADVETTETEAQEAQETTAQESTPTVEELQAKIAALEANVEKQKKSISNACADAAEWKRKYRATLDESERKTQEAEEETAEMKRQLAEFKRKECVSANAEKLVASGYDFETARAMAEFLPDDIPSAFFEQQKAFIEATHQRVKTQSLNSQPSLSTGMPPATQQDAMTDEEKQRLKRFGLI